MTMKLMHISVVESDLKKAIDVFLPRVPRTIAYMEDAQQKRVCTAESVVNCVKGHPFILSQFNADSIGFDPYDSMSQQSCLLELGKSGFLCQLYYFEVPKEMVKTPAELVGFVPDIKFTDEHWIMESVKPVKMQYVLIEGATRLIENGEIVGENYKYTIFDTIEEMGTIVNCLDYHVFHDYILKEFSLKCQPDIWGVRFSVEQANAFKDHIARERSIYEEEQPVANSHYQNDVVNIQPDELPF